MIIVALASPQLVTPVNQKLTHTEEFGEPEAAPRPCSFHRLSGKCCCWSPHAGAMGFSSWDSSVLSSHLPDPHKAAHIVSLEAQRIFIWWPIGWIAIGKKLFWMSQETFNTPWAGKTQWTHRDTIQHREGEHGMEQIPPPQHKAQEKRFYFSCWKSIRKHKASHKKVIFLFARNTCKKGDQETLSTAFPEFRPNSKLPSAPVPCILLPVCSGSPLKPVA